MKKLFFVFSLLLIANFSWSQISTLSSPLGGTTTQAAAIVDPPPADYNTIEFEYDNAGNQTKRKFIYLAPRMSNQNQDQKEENVAKQIDYIESDIYPEISYFPNPVRSELFIKWTDTTEKDIQSIELYDLNGRLFFTLKNQSNQETATVNFENYPTGIYNVVLRYSSSEIKNLKVVKQ